MAGNPSLARLQRPSGAFAMLAIDQRESMRAMFAEKQASPVSNDQLVQFKIDALRTLTPLASAALIDREFGWRPAIEAAAVDASCGLIAAADKFIASDDEIVADVEIDYDVIPEQMKVDGAVALKLLVTWRPDESSEKRIKLVDEFVARCKRAGLLSIIEPVARRPRDGRAWDTTDGIMAAARELGDRGADLYKAEVPHHGKGGEKLVRAGCADLTRIINGPWVVLSSGVEPDDFPRSVEWACREGASGFLAGRAVWRNVIGSEDIRAALANDALPRLRRLCEIVDSAVSAR